MWNRRLHYYLGLYFLFFLLLFSITGLLLNHPRWAISGFSDRPTPRRVESPIAYPAGNTDLARARNVMRQLNLSGEIDWPTPVQSRGQLEFNVNRPKVATQVRADLAAGRAAVQSVERSFWEAFRISHTFSGSRYNTPRSDRDFYLTTLWVIAMDALAGGLLVMVFSSYYMWFQLKPDHRLGWIALGAGVLSCGWFIFGLGLL